MSELRDTYAEVANFPQRLKGTAAMLCISENTLRAHLAESNIEILRQSSINPSAPAIRIFSIEKIFEIAHWRRLTGKVKKITDRPISIVVNLIKGGVGKSTTSAEVATQLQLRGYKVLIIDFDSSSNLSSLMGYEPDLEEDEAESYGLTNKAIIKYTFDHLCTPYIDSKRNREPHWVDSKDVIKKPFGEYGPHLIPSDVYLGDLADKLATVPGDRDHVIKAFLTASRNGKIPGFNTSEYDFILMDCAPTVSVVSLNAMATADFVIAPVKMDLFGAKGISRLNNEINGLKSRAQDVDLELIILPTHFSTNLSRTGRMVQQLQAYRDNLTMFNIPQSELFPSSQSFYMPLTLQMPTCAPVNSYREFVEFLLKKITKKFS